MPHIVDQLIEERAASLRKYPRLRPLLQTVLYPLMSYKRARHLTDVVRDLSGLEVLDYVSAQLELQLHTTGIEHLPKSGRAMLIANHPAGIADGIAVYDALKHTRDDIVFFANRDAIRIAPNLLENIIPVEWIEEKRTHQRQKETVKRMVSAFRDDRLIVIFPSGRLAHLTMQGLTERPWQPTAVSLAQRYNCPLVPMHIGARNSALFYFLSFLSDELRDITLFRELLNKKHQNYRMRIGAPIQPLGDTRQLTEDLQKFVVEQLANDSTHFEPSWKEKKLSGHPEVTA